MEYRSIFICYRRADSADVTSRIYDRLVDHFGPEHVFKDVDSMPIGVDFRRHLDEKVASCGAFIAVIGQRWLEADSNAARALDQPTDFVKVEIEAALRRGIRLFPVTVHDARIPAASAVPESMREMVYRQAMPVRSDPDFHRDVSRLIEGLEAHFTQLEEAQAAQEAERKAEEARKNKERRQAKKKEAKLRWAKAEAKRIARYIGIGIVIIAVPATAPFAWSALKRLAELTPPELTLAEFAEHVARREVVRVEVLEDAIKVQLSSAGQTVFTLRPGEGSIQILLASLAQQPVPVIVVGQATARLNVVSAKSNQPLPDVRLAMRSRSGEACNPCDTARVTLAAGPFWVSPIGEEWALDSIRITVSEGVFPSESLSAAVVPLLFSPPAGRLEITATLAHTDVGMLLDSARTALAEGRYADAQSFGRRVLELSPDNAAAFAIIAQADLISSVRIVIAAASRSARDGGFEEAFRGLFSAQQRIQTGRANHPQSEVVRALEGEHEDSLSSVRNMCGQIAILNVDRGARPPRCVYPPQ